MCTNIQTIIDFRIYLSSRLEGLYPEREIRSIATVIIKTLFETDRLHNLQEEMLLITPDLESRLKDITLELENGRPVQYILGETEFYNCRIVLKPVVLIPRQETEEVVDLVIRENRGFTGNIIDIGTGSGCIAIALARNIHSARVTGTDLTDEILSVARTNAEINGVDVSFIKADILKRDYRAIGRFSILVSNPPYVRESERQFMGKNVLDFEPGSALFVPDDDPLLFYRKILESIPFLLEEGGSVYFEINEAMGDETEELMKSFYLNNISIIRDLNGKNRIAKGIYNGWK